MTHIRTRVTDRPAMGRRRLAPVLALAACALLAASSPASAADITGAWDLPAGSVATQSWTFTAGTGTLAGEGGGGPYTWPMAGTISGNAVQIVTAYREVSYTAYFVGTVAADGNSMSGTWATGSFAAASASSSTWIANRRTPVSQPPAQPGAKNTTGVAVRCDRGPNPGDDSRCTATVGDGGANPTQPTGEVAFTAGDGGTFRFGPRCALQPSPGSPTVASCSVTYIPPPGGGWHFPDVTATYEGDATHAGASGRTRLLSGAVFGLADGTPITPDACKSAANTATGTGKKAKASYQAQNPNPLTKPGATAGDFVSFCATNLALNVWGGAVRVGQGAAVVTGAAVSVAGGVIAVGDPEPVGKVVGVEAVVAGPVIAYGGVRLGQNLIEANDRALADPPDKRYRVTVKPKAGKRIVVRPGGGVSRAAAKRLTTALTRQARAASLAAAFAAALDKAGGAREADQPRYVGSHTRAAIGFAKSLAAELDRLITDTRRIASLAGKGKLMRTKITAAQIERRRAGLAKRLPAKLVRSLRQLGWDARDLALLRASLARKPDPAQIANAPTTAAGVVGDPALLQLYEQAALAMRYFSVTPSVVAQSKLG